MMEENNTLKTQSDLMHLHPYQMQVLKSKARFVLASAGWQGGKTTAGAVKLAALIDRDTQVWVDEGSDPKRRPAYWIMAPTADILNNATIPKFLEILPSGSYRYKEGKKQIIMQGSGVTVYGKSAFSINSLESATLNGIWADEAGQYKRQSWNKMRPRINVRGGFILFTTTPYAVSWLYDEVYLKWQEGDPDFDVITWDSIDNPYFDPVEYEKEKRRMSPEEFDMKYRGRFTNLKGMIYQFLRDKHTKPLSFFPDAYDVVICGLDFGISKPCGVSVIGIRDGIYYVLAEFKQAGVEWEQLSDRLYDFQSKYHFNTIYADPEDPKAIRFLREQGHVIRAADNDVQGRLRSVRILLGDDKLFVLESLDDTIKEFQGYSRIMDNDGFYVEEPAKRNDHLMDAMGYAIYNHIYSKFDKFSRTILNLKVEDLTKPNAISDDVSAYYHIPKFLEEQFGKPQDQLNSDSNSWWNYDL
jgi:phage terminase large subunit